MVQQPKPTPVQQEAVEEDQEEQKRPKFAKSLKERIQSAKDGA